MRAPIHQDKHYVQFPFSTIATGTRENVSLALAVEGTAASTVDTVVEGSLIKAVYVELWCQNTSSNGHQIVTLSKEPINATGPTFAQMASLGTYPNKKNIFFTHEGLSANDGVSGPQRILGDWFKIPKGKQRMGLGDRIVLSISNPSANTLNRCGFTTYKETT